MGSSPPEPTTDLTTVFAELAHARELAAAGQVDQVAEVVREIDDRRPFGQSATVVSVVCEVPGVETALEKRLEEAPQDPITRLLLAHQHVVLGWEARTSRPAEQVGAEQFELFHEWLRRAEQALIELCGSRPLWAMPWHPRLMTARGLELGQSEARRRYDRLAALSPHHLGAQSQLLQRLCPKWGGTWDLAFGFARECADQAPAGSPISSNVAAVHLERWLEERAGARLDDPEVRADIDRAEAASIGHPDYESGFYDPALRSIFGALHVLGGRTELALPHFRALGGYLDPWVWGYLTGPARDEVQAPRAQALAIGGLS